MPLGTEIGLGPGDIVLDWDAAPHPKKGTEPPPHFRPVSIVAKQLDGSIWHLAWRWALVQATLLDEDPAPIPKKETEPLNFRPILLWQNGCMHQDGTWYGGRPQPRRLCVRWGPSYSQKKRAHPTPTQSLAHVYCGQTAGWMKTPLGTDVDLGACHIVLDGVPAVRERGTAAPSFRGHNTHGPMCIVATVAHLSYC